MDEQPWRIITASEDATAKLWASYGSSPEAESSKITLQAQFGEIESIANDSHHGGITHIGLSHCNTMLATSSRDTTARIWHLPTGRPLRSLPYPDPVEQAKKINSFGSETSAGVQSVLSTSTSATNDVSDRAQGTGPSDQATPVSSNISHTACVNMAVWSPHDLGKNRTVITCSDDHSAILWNALTGESTCELHSADIGHTGPVIMSNFSSKADPIRVLTCSVDQHCIIWDAQSGQPIQRLPLEDKSAHEHSGPIWSAYFSQDDHFVVTASKDKTIKLWDLTKGAWKSDFEGHTDMVLHARWSPHNPHEILSCSLDCTARVWDMRSGTDCVQTLENHTRAVWSARYSDKNSHTMVTAGHDMTAMVWDVRQLTSPRVLSGHTGVLWDACISKDGNCVATCSEDRTARVWDITSSVTRGQIVSHASRGKRHPTTHQAGVCCVEFVPF